MTNFSYDLGFDWNATADSEGHLPLDIGRVNLNTGTADTMDRGLTVEEDFVRFAAFNMTSEATQIGYSIVGGTITFQNQDQQQAATSPFNVTEMEISLLGQATEARHSVVLGPQPSEVEHPCWIPVVPLLQTITSGTFQFAISLMVEGPGGTKTFVGDPEMIVEGIG